MPSAEASNWSRESWDLEVTQLDLPLAERSGASAAVTRNVFVTLRFASVAGVGEVNPEQHELETVVAQLKAVEPRGLLNPFNLEGVLDILPAGAARCAVDIALHDLAGKIAGLSVTKLLGLKDRMQPRTSLTGPVDPVVERADVDTARDVAGLGEAVGGVNLKLRRAGGIREALRVIATARSHGLRVMLGSDLVTGIGATADAHLAPLVDFLDIDEPLLLKEDPFPGVVYDKGRITVPDLPGLGVKGAPS